MKRTALSTTRGACLYVLPWSRRKTHRDNQTRIVTTKSLPKAFIMFTYSMYQSPCWLIQSTVILTPRAQNVDAVVLLARPGLASMAGRDLTRRIMPRNRPDNDYGHYTRGIGNERQFATLLEGAKASPRSAEKTWGLPVFT